MATDISAAAPPASNASAIPVKTQGDGWPHLDWVISYGEGPAHCRGDCLGTDPGKGHPTHCGERISSPVEEKGDYPGLDLGRASLSSLLGGEESLSFVRPFASLSNARCKTSHVTLSKRFQATRDKAQISQLMFAGCTRSHFVQCGRMLIASLISVLLQGKHRSGLLTVICLRLSCVNFLERYRSGQRALKGFGVFRYQNNTTEDNLGSWFTEPGVLTTTQFCRNEH